MSGVSRAALAAAHAACDGSAPSVAEGALTPDAGGSAYAARKAEAGATSGYAEAKREALSQPGLWSLSAPAPTRVDDANANGTNVMNAGFVLLLRFL